MCYPFYGIILVSQHHVCAWCKSIYHHCSVEWIDMHSHEPHSLYKLSTTQSIPYQLFILNVCHLSSLDLLWDKMFTSFFGLQSDGEKKNVTGFMLDWENVLKKFIQENIRHQDKWIWLTANLYRWICNWRWTGGSLLPSSIWKAWTHKNRDN